MTYEQFLIALRATPRDWYLDDQTRIRRFVSRGSLCECPISALAHEPATRYPAAAKTLGIQKKLAESIALAADDTQRKRRLKAVRADLLAACGLEWQ